MLEIKEAACFVLLLAVFIIAPEKAYSQKVPTPATACVPDGQKLENLCAIVTDRMEDPDPDSPYVYLYQRMIDEASCVDPEKDSEEVRVAKINKMWNQFEPEIGCNSTKFDVTNGSILKLAVANGFNGFIYDVVNVWKVNLNRVDKSDNLTVLDYLQAQIIQNKNSTILPRLNDYHAMLRRGGAKYRAELVKD